jgi:hypothetical protein
MINPDRNSDEEELVALVSPRGSDGQGDADEDGSIYDERTPNYHTRMMIRYFMNRGVPAKVVPDGRGGRVVVPIRTANS